MSTPKPIRGKTTGLTGKLAFLKELPGKLRLPKLSNLFFSADCFLGAAPKGIDASKGGSEHRAVRFSPSADPFMTAMRFSQKMPHPGLTLSVLETTDTKQRKPVEHAITGERMPDIFDLLVQVRDSESESLYTPIEMGVGDSFDSLSPTSSVYATLKHPALKSETQRVSKVLRLMTLSIEEAREALTAGDIPGFHAAITHCLEYRRAEKATIDQAKDPERARMTFSRLEWQIADLSRNAPYIQRFHQASTIAAVHQTFRTLGEMINEADVNAVLIGSAFPVYQRTIAARNLQPVINRIGDTELRFAEALGKQLKRSFIPVTDGYTDAVLSILRDFSERMLHYEAALRALRMQDLVVKVQWIRREINQIIFEIK